MKRLYVCGSFRFTDEMNELEAKLRKANIEYRISKNRSPRNHWVLGQDR